MFMYTKQNPKKEFNRVRYKFLQEFINKFEPIHEILSKMFHDEEKCISNNIGKKIQWDEGIEYISIDKLIDEDDDKSNDENDNNINENDNTIDENEEELRQLFWKARFNKDWILLTKEIITEYFGFKDNKHVYINFIRQNLKPNFKEDIDYKKVDKNEEIIEEYTKNSGVKNNNQKIPHNIQFYIITGHCFKELMMKYSTNARSYYIKLESLASFIYTCIKEYLKNLIKIYYKNMNIYIIFMLIIIHVKMIRQNKLINNF